MTTKPETPEFLSQDNAPKRNSHDAPPEELRDEFARLVDSWKMGHHRGFDVAEMVEHPAYQRIIEMGQGAVPLILEELEREVDHWFPALRQLTGASPVPEESKGNLAEMRDAWLGWGRDEDYV